MLTREELQRLPTDLEPESVERVRAFDKAEGMGQAICAFANDLAGRGIPGCLPPGVENDGRGSGRRLDEGRLNSRGGPETEGDLPPPPSMALEVFHLEGGDVAVDAVFSSARLGDLDVEVFRCRYLPGAVRAEVVEDDGRPVQEQLAALRFFDLEGNVPTDLGMLLSGRHPEMFIPSAYLQCVRSGGPDNPSRPVRVSAFQERTFVVYPDWFIRP